MSVPLFFYLCRRIFDNITTKMRKNVFTGMISGFKGFVSIVSMVSIFSMVSIESFAADRTTEEMRQIAASALQKHKPTNKKFAAKDGLKEMKSLSSTKIFGYDDGGFAVVSKDDLMPAVLGYSDTQLNMENPNFKWWLDAVDTVLAQAVQKGLPLTTITPDPSKYDTDVESMVTSKWGQEEPYWNKLVEVTGYKLLTGCVATAISQVLRYHGGPDHGKGQHSVSYKGKSIYCDYDTVSFDFDHMRDLYDGQSYTAEEADAVATLMMYSGVAVEMDYSPSGSGTYHDIAAKGIREYFDIPTATYYARSNYSDAEWMDMVFESLNAGNPIVYGGDDLSPWVYSGHSFVLDGYRADGMVSVNWGWNGEDDGYYSIDLLNPGGYTFKDGQDMILGINPEPAEKITLYPLTVNVEEPGTLGTLIPDSMTYITSELTITGKINANDFAAMRTLCKVVNDSVKGRTYLINLKDAEIVEGTIPLNAFMNCTSLKRIVIPDVTEIGSNAFSGCTKMGQLKIYSTTPPTLGKNVFANLPENCTLLVKAGYSTKYSRKTQWNRFANHITEFGTTLKVRNCIRGFGEENPEFTYNMVGDYVSGEPTLSCEATKYSAPGTYPIIINKDSMFASDIEFIDGFMIIKDDAVIGDANNDKQVDVADITATANRILGNKDDDFFEFTADANKDGVIDVADITSIAQIILSGTEE